jgi:hypothetical protein
MRSVVHFTTCASSGLADDLSAAGYTVSKAKEISKVMYLCEHNQVDVVIIGADVEEQDMVEIQLRRTTIKLEPNATAKSILWELSNLFGTGKEVIQ